VPPADETRHGLIHGAVAAGADHKIEIVRVFQGKLRGVPAPAGDEHGGKIAPGIENLHELRQLFGGLPLAGHGVDNEHEFFLLSGHGAFSFA